MTLYKNIFELLKQKYSIGKISRSRL